MGEKIKTTFLDVTEATINGYCSGFVNLEFISDVFSNKKFPLFCRSYVLNCEGDGWFRRIDGQCKGYGIALKKIEYKPSKYFYTGDFNTYKAKITYLDDKTELQTAHVWLNIHNNFTIDEVMKFIENMYKDYNP